MVHNTALSETKTSMSDMNVMTKATLKSTASVKQSRWNPNNKWIERICDWHNEDKE